jgi:outer membrane receptor protein involved in Fe transport
LTGHPLAEVMLGSAQFGNWGNFLISPYNQGQSAFVMDDWKVNTKLTLQLGLRYDHDNGRRHRYPYGSVFDVNAKNVLTPNAGWSWDQVVSAVPDVASFPQPAWLTEGVNGRQVLINTPEYPQKTLFDTPWGFLQPRVGVSFALNDKTVLHGNPVSFLNYKLLLQGFFVNLTEQ